MHKRGTDRTWEIYRNRGDAGHYARCKCGYYYCCGKPDPANGLEYTYHFHRYCPNCGVRKRWRTQDVTMEDPYNFATTLFPKEDEFKDINVDHAELFVCKDVGKHLKTGGGEMDP